MALKLFIRWGLQGCGAVGSGGCELGGDLYGMGGSWSSGGGGPWMMGSMSREGSVGSGGLYRGVGTGTMGLGGLCVCVLVGGGLGA